MRRIFLMLGPECNLQCKYCLQHEMVDVASTTVSADVIAWIARQAAKTKGKLNVTFYGGEPLVHFSAIRQTVAALEGENVRFSIITNGKLLTADKVAYLNAHNFSACVSWDGANVLATRGYDALTNSAIMGLNRLCMSAVMSAYTYPKDFLDSVAEFSAEYRAQHGKNHALNIDTILDFGNCGELRQMDTNKIREQITEVMQGGTEVYRLFADKMQTSVKRLPNGRNNYAPCGNGVSVFNVDINGNIYRCHNCGERLGTIYDDIDTIIARARALDRTAERYAICKDCSVAKICRTGCPMIDDTARLDYYCEIRRAFYEPVLGYIQSTKHATMTVNGNEIIFS